MADAPDIGTCLRRIDELRDDLSQTEKDLRHELGQEIKALADKVAAVTDRLDERTARLTSDINKLDRENLKEGFSIKQQVAAIGWRVGVVVAIGIFVLTFIFKGLQVTDLLGTSKHEAAQSRKR